MLVLKLTTLLGNILFSFNIPSIWIYSKKKIIFLNVIFNYNYNLKAKLLSSFPN